jgi:hypothetical protein
LFCTSNMMHPTKKAAGDPSGFMHELDGRPGLKRTLPPDMSRTQSKRHQVTKIRATEVRPEAGLNLLPVRARGQPFSHSARPAG